MSAFNLQLGYQTMLSSPWFMVGLTIAAFKIAQWFYQKAGNNPFLQPVLVGLGLTILGISLLGIDYPAYRQGANLIYLLLGPATVALAVPMSMRIAQIKSNWQSITAALCLGGSAAVLSALLFMYVAGADDAMLATVSTKSITGAIAMQVAEGIGGYGALAAVIVLVTGVGGAIVAPWVFKLCNIQSESAQGFALGVAAHAVGTARAFEISETAGAFAALGMSLMGIVCAIIIPLVFLLL